MKYYSSIGIKDNNDQDHQKSKKLMINGQRPSPLKINKDSHTMHKPSEHNHHHDHRPIKRQQPVIIYTHSPKIIHTQARDFMALVQTLTGLTRDDQSRRIVVTDDKQLLISGSSSYDAKSDNDSSSISTDEIDCNVDGRYRNFSLSTNPNYFDDIPLFTPNGTDHSNVGSSSLSPTFLEFMKGLPEY